MTNVAPTQQVFDSLVVLFRDAQQYDAKPLNSAYAASLMRLGIKLATERRLAEEALVRDAIREAGETQAKPSARKKPPASGSSA